MPIFYTVPVGKIAKAYISRQIHAWDNEIFANSDYLDTWEPSLIDGKNKIPLELESTANFPFNKR